MTEKNDIIKEKIRERLIRLRISHFLTQTQEGEIVGKSKTAVASWEQGLSIPDPWELFGSQDTHLLSNHRTS